MLFLVIFDGLVIFLCLLTLDISLSGPNQGSWKNHPGAAQKGFQKEGDVRFQAQDCGNQVLLEFHWPFLRRISETSFEAGKFSKLFISLQIIHNNP